MGRLRIISFSSKINSFYFICIPQSDALGILLLLIRKELEVNHVQPRQQGRRILCAGSSIGMYHGMVTMKWSGGLRATQKRHWHLLEQPDSCIINSSSVSNPAGITGTTHRQLHCTTVHKMFSLCFVFITCAKLSIHSVLMPTNHQWTRQQIVLVIPLSLVTAQCSISSGRCTQTLQVILKLSYSCHRENNQSKFKVYWVPHCYTHLAAGPQHHGKPRAWSVEESMPPEASLLLPAGRRKHVACPASLPL